MPASVKRGQVRRTLRIPLFICRASTIACVLLAVAGVVSADIPLDQRRSGYRDLGRDTSGTVDPATLWVQDGETLWNGKQHRPTVGAPNCQPDATVSMKGVAARYPAFSRTQL